MDKLKRTPFLRNNPKGFTLIEIMISLVISMFIIYAIYETFKNQNKSYIIQDGVVEMQQTLRGALLLLERDIRMAGYDPLSTSLYNITTATNTRLGFDADMNDNGGAPATGTGTAETFLYELYDPVVSAGTTVNSLRRTPNGSAVASNIEALQFAYAYDSDADGNVERNNNTIWAYPNPTNWYSLDTNDDGIIDQTDTAGGVDTLTSFNLAAIRAVRVWILVRNDKPDIDYVNRNTYVVGSTHFTPPANDHFRRVLLDITVKCRNMGL